MNTEFAIAEVMPGQLNALVKNIMRQTGTDDPKEAVRLINSGEWIVSKPTRCWREQDGIIYMSVTSDGTTGPQWIKRLEKKGFRLSKWAKDVLDSKDFKPTSGVTTEIAILKGMLFEDDNRVTHKIRAFASDRKFTAPNAEVACLIRENFSDDDIKSMGLTWIIAMHEPIEDSDGALFLLSVDRDDDGLWLLTYYGSPGSRWARVGGFAFAVSQVQN